MMKKARGWPRFRALVRRLRCRERVRFEFERNSDSNLLSGVATHADRMHDVEFLNEGFPLEGGKSAEDLIRRLLSNS
jgi:hypothetical protein